MQHSGASDVLKTALRAAGLLDQLAKLAADCALTLNATQRPGRWRPSLTARTLSLVGNNLNQLKAHFAVPNVCLSPVLQLVNCSAASCWHMHVIQIWSCVYPQHSVRATPCYELLAGTALDLEDGEDHTNSGLLHDVCSTGAGGLLQVHMGAAAGPDSAGECQLRLPCQ